MLISTERKGFTVIETLIGIALFGVIMPSVILAVVSISRLNDRALDLTRANLLAESKIEELRSQGYNSLPGGGTFTDEMDDSFSSPKSATFTVTSTSPGVKEILVEIEYKDQNKARELEYKSIFSELGVSQ